MGWPTIMTAGVAPLYIILLVFVHLISAVAVYSDAKKLLLTKGTRNFFSPGIWFTITLIMGPYFLVVYWAIHYLKIDALTRCS